MCYVLYVYCLAVVVGFYSDVVQCLPVDQATLVRLSAGTSYLHVFIFYDNHF